MQVRSLVGELRTRATAKDSTELRRHTPPRNSPQAPQLRPDAAKKVKSFSTYKKIQTLKTLLKKGLDKLDKGLMCTGIE